MSLTPINPTSSTNQTNQGNENRSEHASTASPSTPEASATPNPANMVEVAWIEYVNHLKKWFYNPDIEAVQITLAAVTAHFYKNCDPCWLFILGPSGGDKTSININSIVDFPQVHPQSEITAKTFLSGYTGTAHPSLLYKIGDNGILAFKDFTTFASKRPEERSEIAAQLREIADGSFRKVTGKGVQLNWQGKITVIAAATPSFENEWALHRSMGERFVQVRLNRKDGVKQSEFAQRQRGYEEYISSHMRKLALAFFQATPPISYPPPRLTNNQMTRVASMAEIVAHCRGVVPRHPITGAINDIAQIENAGRMSKALAAIISGHAALFRRAVISEDDMNIGKRIALNTIPSKRALVISAVPIQGSIANDRLQLIIGLPKSTTDYIVSDLEALGVLKVTHNTVVANEVALEPAITSLWNQAFDPLALIPEPQQPEAESVH